ncbi:MAG: MbcA/ParS/Xre antitoxin family protein [Bacteroidota bacterium]|nr:MbcA/ParS/Xre antitoxin family protein [Bacteroidota bacterium]
MKKNTGKLSFPDNKKKHQELPVVKEPALAYSPVRRKELPMSAVEKMQLSRAGVTKEYLEKVKLRTHLDYNKLARVLGVTRATLINKQKEEKFNPMLSERIIGLAELYDFGFEVFDDEEKFHRWMFSPNKALGGEQPFDLLDNQFGREEVKNILGRIQYGVYS